MSICKKKIFLSFSRENWDGWWKFPCFLFDPSHNAHLCLSIYQKKKLKKLALKAWIITRIYIICLAIFKGCQVLQKWIYKIFHSMEMMRPLGRTHHTYTHQIKTQFYVMSIYANLFYFSLRFFFACTVNVIFHLRTWTNKRKIILHSFLYFLVKK